MRVRRIGLPGGGAEILYPSITPVNTFRVIFNRYLGTDLDMLDDINYFQYQDDSGRSFSDVTDVVTNALDATDKREGFSFWFNAED